MWGWGRRRDLKHPLDRPLLKWSDCDQFRLRDLLASVLILGRSGSAKTTSSGRTLMQAVVNDPQSGGLLLAAKPEDADDVREVFRKARRLQDLILFDAEGPWRFNFLDYVGKGQTRNVVQCLMMIGQTLKRGEGGGGKDDAPFWEALNERLLYNAVAALQAAGEPVTGQRILRFIMTAATSPEELGKEAWQSLYHFKAMERAHGRPKTPVQAHDFELLEEFWINEYPRMDPKTRSNGLAGVMNILHTFNTGLVREMASGETNCSPDDVLDGKWVLVNFPPSAWGEVGSFICSGWKYLTELAILQRKADDATPFATIWVDEAHLFVTNFDSTFVAQSRSHRGCLVYLTQSVSSFYGSMKGENGRHQADALLANFSHVIVHASDPVTAKWASSKLGRCKEVLYSGSSSPQHDAMIWDQMYSQQQVNSSFSEHYESVLQDQEFMVGRTGGPDNRYLADAIVIKSGEPFADGKSYKRVTFSQR